MSRRADDASIRRRRALPLRAESPSRRGPSAVGLLTLFILLLVAIPSRLIVGPLGGAGTPAQILAMLLAGYWVATRIMRQPSRQTLRQPIRVAMLLLCAAIVISYIVANTRAIDGTEMRAADVGMLLLVGWVGVAFATMDLIPTRADLDTVLRRLVFAGGALATLGLLQFVTKQPFTNYIEIPGLRANTTLNSVYERGGLTRPAGTALHPLEFAAVLTMILPLALHYAILDDTRSALRRWYPALVIGGAIPISISRSAVLSAIVVLAFILPTWPPLRRRYAYVAIVGLMAVLYLVVPGLIGTISDLFTGISNEGSAQSRTNSYALAGFFISHSPLFGRGFGTFLPAYRILDNQYLGMLIETGIVGLLCLLGVFATAITAAVRVRRGSDDEADRSLAQSLAAAVASACASLALFDGFSFPMAATLVFFLIGCIGALRRVTGSHNSRDATTGRRSGASASDTRTAPGP